MDREQTKTRSKLASSYVSQYNECMEEVADAVTLEQLHTLLVSGGISIAKNYNEKADVACVTLVKVENRGALLHFRVAVGPYRVGVLMLNVPAAKSDEQSHLVYRRASRRVMYRTSAQGETYISKRIYFTNTTMVVSDPKQKISWSVAGSSAEIQEMLVQCVFAKLCDALGIGARIGSPDHSFDVVCYENCIEFFMERCEPIEAAFVHHDMAHVRRRLKYCLKALHVLGLVHKDIKPGNILTNSGNDAVLVDFGISGYSGKQLGEKSWVYREGTPSYMSPDMQKLQYSGFGEVDLYHNDVWGLQVTLSELSNKQVKYCKAPVPELRMLEEDFVMHELEYALKNVKNFDFSEVTTKLFDTYFQQLGGKADHKSFNMNFLVRAMGVVPELLHYMRSTDLSKEQVCLREILFGKLQRLQYIFKSPRLSLKTDLVRKAYRQLSETSRTKGLKAKDQDRFCSLGLQLAKSLILKRSEEVAAEILQEIEPYLSKWHQNDYQNYRLMIQCLQPNYDLNLIITTLKQKNVWGDYLALFLNFLFEKGDYGFIVEVLSQHYPHARQHKEKITAQDVVTLAKAIIEESQQIKNQELWVQILQFFHKCSVALLQYEKILDLSIPSGVQLPEACRLEIACLTFKALRVCVSPESSLAKINEAIELSVWLHSETSVETIQLMLTKAQLLVGIGLIDQAEAIVNSATTNYLVEIVEIEALLALETKLRCDIAYFKESFCEFFVAFEKVMRLQNNALVIMSNPLASLIDMVEWFVPLIPLTEYLPQLRRAAESMFVYCSKPSLRILSAQAYLFAMHMHLAVLFEVVGDAEKQVLCQNKALLILAGLTTLEEQCECAIWTGKLAVMLKQAKQHKKAEKYALIAFEIALKLKQAVSIRLAVELCAAIQCVSSVGTPADIVNNFTRLAAKSLGRQIRQTYQDILFQKVTILLQQGYCKHVQALLQFASHTKVGVYLLGYCEFVAGDDEKCRQLHEKVLTLTQPTSHYISRRLDFLSHYFLWTLSQIRKDTESSIYHGKAVLHLSETLKPLHWFEQSELMFEGMKTAREMEWWKEFHQLKCKMLHIAEKSSTRPVARSRCYYVVAFMSYSYYRYQQTYKYLRMSRRICVRMKDETLRLVLLFACSIMLRKLKAFFHSVAKLKGAKQYNWMLEHLHSRREYIKLHFLDQSYPHDCQMLHQLLQWMTDPLPSNYSSKSLKRRLAELTFLKRLGLHSLYSRGKADPAIKKLKRTFLTLF